MPGPDASRLPDARAVTSPAIFVSSHRQSRLKVVRAARSVQTNPA